MLGRTFASTLRPYNSSNYCTHILLDITASLHRTLLISAGFKATQERFVCTAPQVCLLAPLNLLDCAYLSRRNQSTLRHVQESASVAAVMFKRPPLVFSCRSLSAAVRAAHRAALSAVGVGACAP